MASPSPLVTVLMPVYNAALYVEKAVRSILDQSFTDFELFLFNDGSTDDSAAIIRNITDSRITLFDSVQNKGYVHHLNEGLRLANGHYIARMDADDIALPTRLAQQVALLEQHPDIGLCGTAYDTFGAQNLVVSVPLTDAEVRGFLLFNTPMGHPTVMFRKALVEKHNLQYNHDFMPAEDFKLWYDFSRITNMQNLPDVLLHYRVHQHQISSYQNEKQRANADKVRLLQLTDKGFQLTPEEQQLYCQIVRTSARPQTAGEFKKMLAVMWTVKRQNEQLRAYNWAWFVPMFAQAWYEAVNGISHFTFAHLPPLLLEPKPLADPFNRIGRLKLFVKTMVHWRVAPAALPSGPDVVV